MSLAEQIIHSGPYQAGDTSPFYGGVDLHDLNALRDELLELRQLRTAAEQRERYKISAERHRDGYQLRIIHTDSHWSTVVDDLSTLAELVRRAGEHAKDCP